MTLHRPSTLRVRSTFPALLALLGGATLAVAVFLVPVRQTPRAQAAISGTVTGSAAGVTGQIFIQYVPPTYSVAYPPSATESVVPMDFRSIDKRVTLRASSMVSDCTSAGSTAQVLDVTCTVTMNNMVLLINETEIITAERIVARSHSFSFGGTTASDTNLTEIQNLCIRTSQSGTCMPSATGATSIPVDYLSPRVTGTVTLKIVSSRSSDGIVAGSGLRVVAVQAELTLQNVGTISLSVGVAETFIGGAATPVPTPTPTALPATPAPTPSLPGQRRFLAIAPSLSRD
jgi:hypothetical protein